MNVSGFAFIRNAVTLDYPVIEAVESVLPLVDEFVINVGRLEDEADDGTLDLVRSINSPKLRIIQSKWNPNLSTGGYVYAQQTNIALFNCQGQWAVHVQCDEIVHDQDYDILKNAMSQYADNDKVDALTLWQHNFFGDYQTKISAWPWTGRRKCWIVKPHHFVLSRGDAANFTVHPKFKERGRKVRAVQTAARQFHYSEVKSQKALAAKYANNARFWKRGAKGTPAEMNLEQIHQYYHSALPKQFVRNYNGAHPKVMASRIASHPIHIDHNRMRTRLTRSERIQLARGWLVNRTTDRFTQRGDYVLVGKHS